MGNDWMTVILGCSALSIPLIVIGIKLFKPLWKWLNKYDRKPVGGVTPYQTKAHFDRIDSVAEMQKLDPVAFEEFVGSMFKQMGYEVSTTAASGDHGVDLYLKKDGRLGVVQCKRYQDCNQVPEPTVRDFYGVMLHERAQEGYFVTTSSFSLPARSWAQGKFIHLVDGRELAEWAKVTHEKPPVGQAVKV